MHNSRDNGLYGLFSKIVAVFGGACLLTAWMCSSLIPIIVGGVALCGIMGFMNGLPMIPAQAKKNRR